MNHWSDAIRVQGVEAPETLSRLIALPPLIEPVEWGGRGRLTGALGAVFDLLPRAYILSIGVQGWPFPRISLVTWAD